MKIGMSLLVGLSIAWSLVAGPEIIRNPGSPVADALAIALGLLWMIAVPAAYLLVIHGWLASTSDMTLKRGDLVVIGALVGGFTVSYATQAFFVGLGAVTVFNLGGMYESGGLRGLAPLIAGKLSFFGLLAGALVGFVVGRRPHI